MVQEDGKANAAQLAGMCVGSHSSAATEDKHTPLLGFKKTHQTPNQNQTI